MSDPFRPLKDAFGRFATGVGVAACRRDDGGFAAITINSFTSVSLDPPLVLWCIEKKASTFAAFMSADSYAVSILADAQREISDRFTRFGASMGAGEYDLAATGAPLIVGRLAGFDCRLVDRHEAGDHVILIGKVEAFDSSDGRPLLYFASNYAVGPSTV